MGLASWALGLSGEYGGLGGSPPLPAGLRFGDYPVSLVASDFNRDGFPDTALAYASGWVVLILHIEAAPAGGGTVPMRGSPRPVRLVTADLNRDGCPDLAALHRQPVENLSIWAGNCDGTFRALPPVTVELGEGGPRDLAIADLNGDGCPEPIAVGGDPGGVAVLRRADCLWDFPKAISPLPLEGLGSRPGAVAVGDFNGDGRPDLALSGLKANDVTLVFGREDGSFGVSAHLSLPLDNGPTALRTADLNRDGLDDLLVVNRFSDYVRVILGPGKPDGRFPTGAGPVDAVVGDFNRDGLVDVVTVNREGRSLTLLAGHGDGTFVPLQTIRLGSRPAAAAETDLNRDGCPDLLVAEATSPSPHALYGLCNGGLGERPPRPPTVEAGGPYRGSPQSPIRFRGRASPDEGTEIIRARWSFGDGELAEGEAVDHRYREPGTYEACLFVTDARGVSAFDCTEVRIEAAAPSLATPPLSAPAPKSPAPVKGKPPAKQSPPAAVGPKLHSLGGRPLPGSLALGDFNGDGRVDLAVGVEHPADEGHRGAQEDPAELVVWLNAGAGTLREGFRIPLEMGPERLAALDLDGDGKLDLLVQPARSSELYRLRSRGDGTFDPPAALPPWFPPLKAAEAWLVRDLDGDGRDDWAEVNAERDLVRVVLARLQAQGWGQARTLEYGVGRSPRAVVSGDFNGDSRIDLATADFLGGSVSLLLGTKGGFRSAPPVRLGGYPRSLLAGDFDGDGLDDVLVEDGLRRTARLLRGDAQTPLQEVREASLPLVRSPTLWTAGDFDGDGLPDVAIAREIPSVLTVLLGPLTEGSGAPPGRLRLPLQPKALATADLNGDGRDELLVLGTVRGKGALYVVSPVPPEAAREETREGREDP